MKNFSKKQLDWIKEWIYTPDIKDENLPEELTPKDLNIELIKTQEDGNNTSEII